LQIQAAFAKGQLKGKIAVESEAKKNFINNVVSIHTKISMTSSISHIVIALTLLVGH